MAGRGRKPQLRGTRLAEVVRLYSEEGLSTTQIGERFGCDPATVARQLRRYGVVMRTRSGGRVLRLKTDPCYAARVVANARRAAAAPLPPLTPEELRLYRKLQPIVGREAALAEVKR